ncbi:hypothetical protein GALMADRAFT_586570 [Galerina marginata CBS 339.88]|uniref:Uncharacterized protein n=1 Tax=Galerina marginata (strain CBS 339.88) TaxID=685588 RepID=A0A067SU82_GALM3|nr:hypothetical protein GALMADRAFT_586570 [Galerina marginata CBS 339.88]
MELVNTRQALLHDHALRKLGSWPGRASEVRPLSLLPNLHESDSTIVSQLTTTNNVSSFSFSSTLHPAPHSPRYTVQPHGPIRRRRFALPPAPQGQVLTRARARVVVFTSLSPSLSSSLSPSASAPNFLLILIHPHPHPHPHQKPNTRNQRRPHRLRPRPSHVRAPRGVRGVRADFRVRFGAVAGDAARSEFEPEPETEIGWG